MRVRNKKFYKDHNISSMRKPYGYDANYYDRNKRWDEARKYLKGVVGQEWNSIYSYICRNKDFREEALELANQNARIVDGRPVDTCGLPFYSGEYYVLDGILKRVPQNKYRPKEPEKIIFTVNGKDYYKFNDVWYQVVFKERTLENATKINIFGRAIISYNDVFGISDGYNCNCFAAAKRSAGKKEIKKIKDKYGL